MASVKTEEKKGKATVRLPLLKGTNAVQQEFYSVNFKNYIIKRGERVEVPEEVARVIEDNEASEDAGILYSNDKTLKAEE